MQKKITLPLPPSLNHAYITRRGTGQRIMTNEARNWKVGAATLVQVHMRGKKPLKTCELTYNFYFPDKRRRDVANLEKLLTDALVGVLIADDNWCCLTKLTMAGFLDKENPRVEILW